MDPDDWQQPQQFRPERFLDESGNVINRDQVIAFSLGIDPTYQVDELGIHIVSLLNHCLVQLWNCKVQGGPRKLSHSKELSLNRIENHQ